MADTPRPEHVTDEAGYLYDILNVLQDIRQALEDIRDQGARDGSD